MSSILYPAVSDESASMDASHGRELHLLQSLSPPLLLVHTSVRRHRQVSRSQIHASPSHCPLSSVHLIPPGIHTVHSFVHLHAAVEPPPHPGSNLQLHSIVSSISGRRSAVDSISMIRPYRSNVPSSMRSVLDYDIRLSVLAVFQIAFQLNSYHALALPFFSRSFCTAFVHVDVPHQYPSLSTFLPRRPKSRFYCLRLLGLGWRDKHGGPCGKLLYEEWHNLTIILSNGPELTSSSIGVTGEAMNARFNPN